MVELYDILTLENDKDYTVADLVNNNGDLYCLLMEVDQEENVLENALIAKIVNVENDLTVVPITDENEIREIRNLFLKNN